MVPSPLVPLVVAVIAPFACDDAALGRIEALGGRLDPSAPRPELEVLEQMRSLARAGDLTASALRARAGRLPVQHAGRAALILAMTWAEGLDPHQERWLVAVALAGDARAGTAALRALDLAGRRAALEEVASLLLERDELRGRAAAALRGLSTSSKTSDELRAWIEHHGDDSRVGREVWALAVRSAPRVWGERAIARAVDGSAPARAGVECLPVADFADELRALVESRPRNADAQWTARAAWRALVASGNEPSWGCILAGLERDEPGGRSAVLEALHTWRTPAGAPPACELWALYARLRGDDEAREHLARALDDRWRRWRLRDPDTGALDTVRSRLQTVLLTLRGDPQAGRRARAWLDALRRRNCP